MRRPVAYAVHALALLLLGLWPLEASRSASGGAYYLTLGSRVAAFNAAPVVTRDGRRFISAAVLDQLKPGPARVAAGGGSTGGRPSVAADLEPTLLGWPPASARVADEEWRAETPVLLSSITPEPATRDGRATPGTGELSRHVSLLLPSDKPARSIVVAQSDSTDIFLPEEHYNPDEREPQLPSFEDQPAAADAPTPQLLSAPTGGSVAPARDGRKRYQLGAHTLDLALRGEPLAGELNGSPVPAADLLDWEGQRFVSAGLLQRLGLVLYYNSLDGCYALCGLVYRVEYNPDAGALALSSLVPLRVTGEQVDEQQLRLDVEGGFFASAKPTDIGGSDRYVQRMSFKSQPQLGRSFVYLRQPERTGYRAVADAAHGYARVDFGNYFRLASYDLTSSGEVSLNIELGAAAPVKTTQLDNPPRLALDFAGVQYIDATQRVAINRGAAKELRIGTPQAGTLRVVLELSEQRDYRVLSKDGGARYYVQLYPRAGSGSTAAQARASRVIMLDAGHGGSDPGAIGVVKPAQEHALNIDICRLVEAELTGMGYKVLQTRTDNRFVSLGARGDYANTALPYVFVSIHHNAMTTASMQGAMTFIHDFAGDQSARLAEAVQAGMVGQSGAVDKGVRRADFFVLRETVMPAILVECGFLSNREECARLLQPEYQAKLARGIAQGIDRYVSGR